MSNITKLEKIASRLMAGMMTNPPWDKNTIDSIPRIAVDAARVMLAECVRHEPTTEHSSAVDMISGLLAVIHGDGGRYERDHGREMAIRAGMVIIRALRLPEEATVNDSLTVAPEIQWITTNGGAAMPCGASQKIEIMFRNNTTTTTCFPEQWEWEDHGYRHNIIKWRPVS